MPGLCRRARARAGEEVAGGAAGELPEVADEVRLVGVAVVGGDAVPVGRLAVAQRTPDVLKRSSRAAVLGVRPTCCLDLVIRCLWLQPVSRARDPIGTVGAADQPPPGQSDLGRGGSAADATQQELIESGEPLAPGPQLADRIPQPPSVAAGQVPQVDESPSELAQRRTRPAATAMPPSRPVHTPSTTENQPYGPRVNCGGSAESCTFTTTSTEVVAGRAKPPAGRLATTSPQHRPVHVPAPRRAGPVRRLAAFGRRHRGEPARSHRRQP